MEIVLRKIGNSKGAVIPAALLKELGLNVGDTLEAVAKDGNLIMAPKNKKKYTLAELLAKCDANAPMPDEFKEWDNLDAVGNEV
ncbi:AbrB/MazE/SpoVT family DNA-binding domain-containing protein [Paraneptunicella aestuarii]|uniref:AbrB/MazE/SpoVT family DNA-binding domain-containing protein n=1 Tax=Paraneptunicella aestuarii TaxID=2831148 RepID=UPI001E5FC934|nr:AbrB/MazE/SpoVT family DNA-binding domain-containing protein [Paraneptunicella aestuarii]UAA39529.1 AbrB/MazE/SpoVT family DNA-binding domain-containing protein [Paraneptunicella aestuarii]